MNAPKRSTALLLASVFVVATCGLVYELLAGTLASYLLGDSVTQFSTIIGTYLFSMGIGSWLSRYIHNNAVTVFVRAEILIGMIGGSSAALLFWLFGEAEHFRVALYALVSIIGILVGLEIPLLMRVLEGRYEFRDLVARVFTFDYVGALLASILFPLVLAPRLGLMRTGFAVGLLNVGVAMWTAWYFRAEIKRLTSILVVGALAAGALITGIVMAGRLQVRFESDALGEPVLYAASSPYQRVVLTRDHHFLKLYLNGNLQFHGRDEYRYHEALVHPPMLGHPAPRHVLVLGGGDGLAVREILRYPSVTSVTLVDLDPIVTQLFTKNASLASLNDSSFFSPKVKVINADAFVWMRNPPMQYDCIIVDFPDPSNFSVGKLFTLSFYRLLYQALAPDGFAVIQSTSPWVARKSFWCVDETLRAAGFQTFPYHVWVPSFGEWGFVMAGKKQWQFPEQQQFPKKMRYLSPNALQEMFLFPTDMSRIPTEVNRLNNQMLVQYFEEEWGKV